MSPPLDFNHIHSFKRLRKSKQYKCMHPDCNYLAAREIVKGKRALCPLCRETYILDGRLLDLATPHCANCTRSTKQEKLNKLQEGLESILDEVL